MQTAVSRDLPAYQRQMSILAYSSGAYAETRTPIPLSKHIVGLIYHRDIYYLLPACSPGSNRPIDWRIREQIAVGPPGSHTTGPVVASRVRRTAVAVIRAELDSCIATRISLTIRAPSG
ncbi:MAG: hypothetical protein R3E31_22935 [Chloroflexota bacterium]